MMSNEVDSGSIKSKAITATRWSLATQMVAKLISPVTQLILAHILVPETFGVIATVTMVVSFADMFSDAGFQKYLIQHEYSDKESYALSANVAFWTNLVISLSLWFLIAVFRDSLAVLVGDPGLGLILVVAGASLPLTALVSVQAAVYQRSFDFRKLFSSRVGSALVVLVLAVPLAFAGFNYWSMIIGTIASNLFLAVWLTVGSEWKPGLTYSFRELGEMFSFSAWSLIEAFVIWLTSWAGTFVLSTVMTQYYLGLYKTSVSLVSAITSLATAALTPVAFATLSRFQGNRPEFDRLFYKAQKYLAFACVPLAAGMFVFRDLIVGVLLGGQWLETSLFLGLYAAASTFVIVFCYMASEAYRSLGKPKYSTLVQVVYLLFLVPALYVGAKAGYEVFSWLVPLVRVVVFVGIHFLVCGFLVGLSPWRMVSNLGWIYLATAIVVAICEVLLFVLPSGYVFQALVLVVAVASYAALVRLIPDLRATACDLLRKLGLGRLVEKKMTA